MKMVITLLMALAAFTSLAADLGTISYHTATGELVQARVLRVDTNEVAFAVGSSFGKMKLSDLSPDDQARLQVILAEQAKVKAAADAKIAAAQTARIEAEKERTMMVVDGKVLPKAEIEIEVSTVRSNQVVGAQIIHRKQLVRLPVDSLQRVGGFNGGKIAPIYEDVEERGQTICLMLLDGHQEKLITGSRYITIAAPTGVLEQTNVYRGILRLQKYQEGTPYKASKAAP